MEWFQYVIILAILIIIALVVIKVNQKDFSSEVNKLVKYLGGKDNIINFESRHIAFSVNYVVFST